MVLEKDIKEVLDMQKESYSFAKKAKKKLEELRGEILEGKSISDNPIRDFVIVAYNTISEKVEEPYRELETRLNKRRGQQILIARENIESWYNEDYAAGHFSSNVNSSLRLGVLTSNIIFELGNGIPDITSGNWNNYANLHGPSIIIPTEKYVKKNHGLEWEIIEGNIEIPIIEINNWDIDGKRTTDSAWGGINSNQLISTTTNLLINVGDDVEKYFRSGETYNRDDISYVMALDLLGAGEQAPEDFRKIYNQNIYDSKIEIIKNLKELIKSDRKLKINIDEIYKRVGSKHEDERSDGMVVIKEYMEEDTVRLSGEERRRLEATRENIVKNLEYAVEMKMSNEKWILAGENPGETLDVPNFISGLCKNYEVKTN